MVAFRPTRLQAEYFQRLVRQMAGSTKRGMVALATVVLLVGGASGNALWGILLHLALRSDENFSWSIHLLGVCIFPLLVLAMWLWARTVRESIRVSIVQDDRPAKVKAFVIFLSPPGSDSNLVQDVIDGKVTGNIGDQHLREAFKASWRMPLEAIAYHAERLKEIIIIPSADQTKSDGKQVLGTYANVDTFIRIVETLIERPPAIDLRVRSLAQCAAESNFEEKPSMDCSKGVDFESVRPLVDVVEFAYAFLRSLGIPGYDVLVDITGGQKVPTIAGAAVALAEGRRFQYVSTHDYRVRTYDVTYLT